MFGFFKKLIGMQSDKKSLAPYKPVSVRYCQFYSLRRCNRLPPNPDVIKRKERIKAEHELQLHNSGYR